MTELELQIIYEDNHLIIVNKKNGQNVQPDKSKDISLQDEVKKYIKEKYNKIGEVFVEAIHRIDKPVSGVVIFAKTTKALVRMNEMMRNHQIEKTYWAIVKNKPVENFGTLVHYIKRDAHNNRSLVFDIQNKDAQKAEMEYKVIAQSHFYFLLEIKLITGRHHQIRAQLGAIGSPIKGDIKYGFKRTNKESGIALHARAVSFVHPVKNEKVTYCAPIPDDTLWSKFEIDV